MIFGFRKRVLGELAELRQLVTKGFQLMGMSLDDLVTAIDTETNRCRGGRRLAGAARGRADGHASHARQAVLDQHATAGDRGRPEQPGPGARASAELAAGGLT